MKTTIKTRNQEDRMKYTKISETEEYEVGIYDGCVTKLYVRNDGLMARIESDTVIWDGNTGTLGTEKTYYAGRDAVRSVVHDWRVGMITNLKWGNEAHHVACAQYALTGELLGAGLD